MDGKFLIQSFLEVVWAAIEDSTRSFYSLRLVTVFSCEFFKKREVSRNQERCAVGCRVGGLNQLILAVETQINAFVL